MPEVIAPCGHPGEVIIGNFVSCKLRCHATAAATIERCARCHKPAHASETNDAGICRTCSWSEFTASPPRNCGNPYCLSCLPATAGDAADAVIVPATGKKCARCKGSHLAKHGWTADATGMQQARLFPNAVDCLDCGHTMHYGGI